LICILLSRFGSPIIPVSRRHNGVAVMLGS
jgi:hypothetical protein